MDFECNSFFDFSAAVLAFNTEEIEDTLRECIQRNCNEFLDAMMDYGGALEDADPDIDVLRITDDEREIRVVLMIHFKESYPSSCADYNHTAEHRNDFEVVIDKKSRIGEVRADFSRESTPLDRIDDDYQNSEF